ncbi:MAG TPA: hypothetical protein VIU12_21740, partial [Chryseolinea sp.]
MMKNTLLVLMLISFAGIAHTQGQPSKTEVPPRTNAKFPKPGEWPAFRRTGTLEGRSPLKGNITKPTIAWKQFVGALESRVVVESGDGKTTLKLPGDEIKISGADSIALAEFIPIPKNEEDKNS